MDIDTLVIGAGPSGLAVGACLKKAGVSALLVDRAPTVGSTWRHHYDRLHLHTDRDHSQLPYLGFPAGTPRWPSRQQVVDYLDGYARQFALDLRLGEEVASVRREGDAWVTVTDRATYRSPRLVVATGYSRVPVVPDWPGRERFRGSLIHSSAYKNGEPYRGKRVLVVGFGNSGGEIAIDLHEHGARPAILLRNPVNIIPRDIMGVPTLALGLPMSRLPAALADALGAPMMRLALGDVRKLGIRKPPYGPIAQIKQHRRYPLIDIGTLDLVRKGHVEILPDLRELGTEDILFSDGKRRPFDAIVAATGYQPRINAFLQAGEGVLDATGCPGSSGVEAAPGLYFCGLYLAPTGLLREIAIEARRIAGHIASRRQAIAA